MISDNACFRARRASRRAFFDCFFFLFLSTVGSEELKDASADDVMVAELVVFVTEASANAAPET
jgi:hypothetical protein